MFTRGFTPIVLTTCLFLLSCSGSQDGQGDAYGERTHASWRMAQPRLINSELIENDVTALISEAENIENKVDSLLEKLRILRAEIKIRQSLDDINHNAVATAEPQAILPQQTQQEAPQIKPDSAHIQKTKIPATKPKEAPVSGQGVVAVRMGVHADKTRLVFDINGSTKHSFEYDKELGLVTVILPETSWNTQSERAYKLSQLSALQATKDGKGTIVALSVKKTSSVKISSIKKAGSKPARLVVDLIK